MLGKIAPIEYHGTTALWTEIVVVAMLLNCSR
jgi:hypothetical protein